MVKVSVIVPNYNHLAFLEQRMNSIFAQTFTDYEIILLDDHSTDGSRERIESYREHPKVSKVILNTDNSGSPFAQWKKGMTNAVGEFIWIAESDDFCDPEFLNFAVKALENGSDIFHSRIINVDADGRIIQGTKGWLDDLSTIRWSEDFIAAFEEELNNYMFFKNSLMNASAVVFRRKAELITLLDSIAGMKYCGDWLFWLQYLNREGNIAYSFTVNNYFRSHPATSRKVQSQKERNKEVLRILRFVLQKQKRATQNKKVVEYYFKTHFHIFPKRKLAANIALAFSQISASRSFTSLWLRYYFS